MKLQLLQQGAFFFNSRNDSVGAVFELAVVSQAAVIQARVSDVHTMHRQ